MVYFAFERLITPISAPSHGKPELLDGIVRDDRDDCDAGCDLEGDLGVDGAGPDLANRSREAISRADLHGLEPG
jgi:hypothetical protein